MPEIEMTGKNVEEAIKKGLDKLGCTKDKAQVKVLDEGTSGLFGLMGAKPARVLISADEVCDNGFSSIEADPKKACETVKKTLSEIISKMGLDLKEIKTSFEDGGVKAEIDSSDSGYIIGKGGQTLDSLEYVTQIIVNNLLDAKTKVDLDCENYRLKQNDKLKILSDKAVEYVNRTGKIYRFEPMNAKERKIIHLYLKNNPAIETFSEGSGVLRKVGIKLASKRTA